MKVFTEIVHYAWALMGGFVGWFLGGFDGFLYALLVFVIIDYLTGVMVAVLEKKVSSSVGFRGIFKKILIFCLVAIGHIIDTQVMRYLWNHLLEKNTDKKREAYKGVDVQSAISPERCGWMQQ